MKCEECLDKFIKCVGKRTTPKKPSGHASSARHHFLSKCMKELKGDPQWGTGAEGARNRLKECARRWREMKAGRGVIEPPKEKRSAPARKEEPKPEKILIPVSGEDRPVPVDVQIIKIIKKKKAERAVEAAPEEASEPEIAEEPVEVQVENEPEEPEDYLDEVEGPTDEELKAIEAEGWTEQVEEEAAPAEEPTVAPMGDEGTVRPKSTCGMREPEPSMDGVCGKEGK